MLKFLSVFTGVFVVNNILWIFCNFAAGYYAALITVLVACLLWSGKKHFDPVFGLFYIACIASILTNEIPDLFRPWERFISFFLISSLASGFICNEFLCRFRIRVFEVIQPLMIGVTIASFCLLPFQFSTGTYFQGITNHSMLLGPCAAWAILFSMYRLLKVSNYKRYFYFSVIFMAVLILFAAASRTALIGMILSVLVFLIAYHGVSLLKLVWVLLLTGMVLLFTHGYWEKYFDNVINKNSGSEFVLDTSSRQDHWQQRIQEFQSSPVFGIGFSSVNITSDLGATFAETGTIETGNSFLSILSMTGLLGGFAFLMIFIRTGANLFSIQKSDKKLFCLLLSLMAFFIVHMQAEGYIFAAGGFLFFSFWLCIGVITAVARSAQPKRHHDQSIVISE